MKVAARMIVFALALAGSTGPVTAQTVDELQQQLARERARSAELMRRIESLEQQLLARQAQTAAPPDETGTRALERALVREGGSLLPAYGLEIEPGFAWVHSDRDDAARLDDAIDGSLGVRFGLPNGLPLIELSSGRCTRLPSKALPSSSGVTATGENAV